MAAIMRLRICVINRQRARKLHPSYDLNVPNGRRAARELTRRAVFCGANDKTVIRISRGIHLSLIYSQSKHRKKIMNIKKIIGITLVVFGLAGCATEKSEEAKQSKWMAEAKVSKADAQATALAQVPRDGEGSRAGEGEGQIDLVV